MRQRVGPFLQLFHQLPLSCGFINAESCEEPARTEGVTGSHISPVHGLGILTRCQAHEEAPGSGSIPRQSSSSVQKSQPGPMDSAGIRHAERLPFLKGISKGRQQGEGKGRCVTSQRCCFSAASGSTALEQSWICILQPVQKTANQCGKEGRKGKEHSGRAKALNSGCSLPSAAPALPVWDPTGTGQGRAQSSSWRR